MAGKDGCAPPITAPARPRAPRRRRCLQLSVWPPLFRRLPGPGAAEHRASTSPARAAHPVPPVTLKPPPEPQAALDDAAARRPRAPRSVAVLALQARALRHGRLGPAASAVADELARTLGCARVSVGFLQRGRVKVCALSGTAEVDHRQALVRAIAAAMDEAIGQRASLMHPLPPGTAMLATAAHEALAALNGRLPLLSVPLTDPGSPDADGGPATIGALLFERTEGFDRATIAAAQDAATFVGPLLALKHQLDQPVSGRIVEAVTPRHAGPLGLSRGQWAAALAALALLAAALWPATFRVVAPARVEGLGQQVLAAPLDGFVASAALRPGAAVKAGQVLMTLEDKDLALDATRWQAEVAQLDKKYREAQTTDDAAAIVLARAKLEQAQAQLDLVRQQLERIRLRAPFDGVLLSGDFSQAVGAPVKRGQTLMTVAPDRQFRIVAEVDEQDIARLRSGQAAQVLFGAFDGAPLALEVTRVAPIATVVDGRNVFEVDGRLLQPEAAAALRAGLRGVVRIDIEPRLQGWIWWHRASQWARRLAWRFIG